MRVGVPIMRGPLRGRWWSLLAGGKVGRVIGGSYEPELTALFSERVRPGSVVFDLGAHIGYYTLLASTLVRSGGRVVACEPSPRNLRHLRGHTEMNRLRNVEIVPAAVCEVEGTAHFSSRGGSGTGHLAAEGALRVATTTVDHVRRSTGRSPDFMKIDVEGAEVELLRGATDTLREARPVIFLSTHGPELRKAATALLSSAGYRCERIGEDPTHSEFVCTPEGAAPTPTHG